MPRNRSLARVQIDGTDIAMQEYVCEVPGETATLIGLPSCDTRELSPALVLGVQQIVKNWLPEVVVDGSTLKRWI